jgi:hypothetical protein
MLASSASFHFLSGIPEEQRFSRDGDGAQRQIEALAHIAHKNNGVFKFLMKSKIVYFFLCCCAFGIIFKTLLIIFMTKLRS